MVKLVWRHSCGADRLPVAVRFPAGPRVRLKTVDRRKATGSDKKKSLKDDDDTGVPKGIEGGLKEA